MKRKRQRKTFRHSSQYLVDSLESSIKTKFKYSTTALRYLKKKKKKINVCSRGFFSSQKKNREKIKNLASMGIWQRIMESLKRALISFLITRARISHIKKERTVTDITILWQ